MLIKPKLLFIISVSTTIAAAIIIAIIQPTWGIDFVGGSLIELNTEASSAELRDFFTSQNLTASVQQTQDQTSIIRTSTLSTETHRELLSNLIETHPSTQEIRFESIGPTIGQELRDKALLAISAAIVAMILYLAYVFRATAGLVSSWKYGIAAAGALVHDVLVVTAVFVIFGHFFDIPIDALFVTAMLAIVGYSVNDTIVLFNRLKQEWLQSRGTFEAALSRAIHRTIGRSLNTSLTTLLVLTALLIWGGSSIRSFTLALTVGTIVGTYSSLFVAPPLLWALARLNKH